MGIFDGLLLRCAAQRRSVLAAGLALSGASRQLSPSGTIVPPPPAGGVFPKVGALGMSVGLKLDEKARYFGRWWVPLIPPASSSAPE